MNGKPVLVAEAAGFLAQRYAGRARDVAELGGGDWSRAFSFQLDGRDLVARFGPYGEDFAKDHQAMAFAGPDLPVPEVLETGRAPGGAYVISQRCYGAFLETLDEAGWRRLLPALLRGLDTLRQLSPPGASGTVPGAGGTLPGQPAGRAGGSGCGRGLMTGPVRGCPAGRPSWPGSPGSVTCSARRSARSVASSRPARRSATCCTATCSTATSSWLRTPPG